MSDPNNTKFASWKRLGLCLAGFVSVGLAVLGILLPLLPTTPFLLMAAFFFARASKRWHRWLIQHRIFGPYIAAFREGKGLTREQKLRVTCSVSVTLAVSIWFTSPLVLKSLLGCIWLGCVGFLFYSRTAPASAQPPHGPRHIDQ